jgi:hypothetical protein
MHCRQAAFPHFLRIGAIKSIGSTVPRQGSRMRRERHHVPADNQASFTVLELPLIQNLAERQQPNSSSPQLSRDLTLSRRIPRRREIQNTRLKEPSHAN